jgi:hypothetical protein
VGAIGALQLARLLASPLPQFWTGTESSPEGPALVAERGPELAVDPSGRLVVYQEPQITYLKKGTRIYDNPATEQILREGRTLPAIQLSVVPQAVAGGLVKSNRPAAALAPMPSVSGIPVAAEEHRLQPKGAAGSLTRFIGALIPLTQVYRDVLRAQESDRQALLQRSLPDRAGTEVRLLRGELVAAITELTQMKKILKDIRSKSGVHIHNAPGVESTADFRRLMKE